MREGDGGGEKDEARSRKECWKIRRCGDRNLVPKNGWKWWEIIEKWSKNERKWEKNTVGRETDRTVDVDVLKRVVGRQGSQQWLKAHENATKTHKSGRKGSKMIKYGKKWERWSGEMVDSGRGHVGACGRASRWSTVAGIAQKCVENT
jgi:hypothetical protein